MLLGAIMFYELRDDPNIVLSGSVALIWGGLAIVVAGFAVRRNQLLMLGPRWMYAAFLFGIISSAAMIPDGDTIGRLACL